MAEFFGLLFSLMFLAVVFLPILTFVRLGRISRELEELRARLQQLESSRQATERGEVAAVSDAPAVVAPLRDMPPGEVQPLAMPDTAETPRSIGGPLPHGAGEPNPAATPVAPAEDLEERIGGRGLLYTGVFVLLLGVSFFLKYAFDNEWINETARIVIGAIAGLGLAAGGVRLATSGLATFGHALVGTGIAILYLVVYAALNFYDLIGRGTAFVLMVLITMAAGVVAHRRAAQSLAVIAVAGGFLTPALVGGNENAQLTLFTYVEILVIATMLLALRHQWPGLNAISYAGTLLTVIVWAARFYTDAQWLRTLLFLTLFCVAFLIILRETRRLTTLSARAVTALLATAPVFYHVAAIILTAEHPPAVHVYLIAFTAVGLWLTVDPYRPLWRLVVLLAAFIPMFGDLTLPEGPSWLLANVITIVAVAMLHVMGLVDRVTRQEALLRTADLLVIHLTGLGMFSLLYETLQPAFPELRGMLAVLLALGAIAVGRMLRPRDEVAWLNSLALAATLVAIGIAVQFDGAPVVMGWAAEGAAVTWLGVRTRNRAFQFGGFALWILATLQLFDSFYETPASFTVLLNARTFATAFVLACGYILAWRLGDSAAAERARMRTTLHVVASALTVAWITAEIRSFWEVRSDTAQAHVYEQMLLSLAWGFYGAIIIAIGMWRQFAPLRYIGIVIIGITSLKVFFYDLWELGGIYRVVGFLAFGVLLVLVSYLYQNRRRADRPQL